jgi:hypothetical protein
MREIKKYHKLVIAQAQLQRAIVLFLDDEDYVNAITLASAAEEVLGKYVEKSGGEPAMRKVHESIMKALDETPMDIEKPSGKEILDNYMNGVKNSLKHHNQNADDFLEADWQTEAINMIVRASTNYKWLNDGNYGEHVQAMINFLEKNRPDLHKRIVNG